MVTLVEGATLHIMAYGDDTCSVGSVGSADGADGKDASEGEGDSDACHGSPVISIGAMLGLMAKEAALALDDPDRYVAAAAVEALSRLAKLRAARSDLAWEAQVTVALKRHIDSLVEARFCSTTAEAGTPF
jgi:hypothetical protein